MKIPIKVDTDALQPIRWARSRAFSMKRIILIIIRS